MIAFQIRNYIETIVCFNYANWLHNTVINLYHKIKSMVRSVTDIGSGRRFTYSINHTLHSKIRASQRGFTESNLLDALDYSIVIRKQGLFFYIVADSKIPESLPESRRNKIKNMVVVVSGDSDSIITCYKAKNNMKHIKKKKSVLV
jgi:hypothetical protein